MIDRTTIWFDPKLTFPINNMLFDPVWIQQNTGLKGEGTGRGQALIFSHHDKNLVYRHYRRGGLFGRIVKDSYFGTSPLQSRAYKELALLSKMRKLKLPVPTPIAARFQPHGITYKADIIIEEIPNSKIFIDILQTGKANTKIWATLGQTIARFHVNGIDHTDLNIRNILIDEDDQFWLIDFDKCSQRPIGDWSQNNLDRLKRSVEKEHEKFDFANWNSKMWQVLLDGYGAEMASQSL